MKLWLRVLAALAVVWLFAAGVARVVHSIKPTPESLARYIDAHPLTAAAPSERPRIIEKVAEQMNRLDFEERRSARSSKSLDGFFQSLTEAERNDFLDRTLPEGFRQMMLALNKMTPEKRKEIVDRALENIRKANAEEAETGSTDRPRRPIDDAQAEKIVQQGMSSFYENANAEVKMDFAPVIEEIQNSLHAR